MGKRLIKALPRAEGAVNGTEPSQEINELEGEMMLSRGYDVLSEILKTKGDESEYNKIVHEQQEFDTYWKQRRAERIKQRLAHY